MKPKCECVSCHNGTQKTFHTTDETEYFCDQCKIYYHFFIKQGKMCINSIFYTEISDEKITYISVSTTNRYMYLYFKDNSNIKLNFYIKPSSPLIMLNKIKSYLSFI